MTDSGRYDSDLQMFVDERRDADRAYLQFLRWLVEHERLERPVADAASDASDAVSWRLPAQPAQPENRPPANWACVPRWFGR